MDEKIMYQLFDVLKKYGKNYSRHGVEANYDLWYENKGWLVDLLRKHPNWDEDSLAVIFEVSQSRNIDSSTVYTHRLSLDQLVQATDLSREAKDQAHQSIFYATESCSSKFLTENATNKIKQISGIQCVSGQKVSRVINSICKKYGIDKHPDYNSVFAKLADSLNPLQITRKALLSVHPCDYLEMSNRDNSWSSCHCLNEGEYQAGTLSYMNDNCTMVLYTVDNDTNKDFYREPKISRQVFCYSEGILLQSRLYPTKDDVETSDAYRNIVQKTLADCLNLPNLWTFKRDHNSVLQYAKTVNGALHYRDYERKDFKATISLLKSSVNNEFDKQSIQIGYKAYCIECADAITEVNNIHCDLCGPSQYTCYECGNEIDKDEVRGVSGYDYCSECCSYCESCHNYSVGDSITVQDSRNYEIEVCDTCFEENYRYCATCEENHYFQNGYTNNGEFICTGCFERDYFRCDKCEDIIRQSDQHIISGKLLCEYCAEEIRASADCTSYTMAA